MRQALVILSAVILVALAWAPSAVQAQAQKGDRSQVVNFEDDTIQGDLSKPDGEYVEARKKARHTKLIQIREEFKDKVLQSVSDL